MTFENIYVTGETNRQSTLDIIISPDRLILIIHICRFFLCLIFITNQALFTIFVLPMLPIFHTKFCQTHTKNLSQPPQDLSKSTTRLPS